MSKQDLVLSLWPFQWECCGAFGADDWNLNIYFNCTDSNPSREKCGVPFSCCTKDPAVCVLSLHWTIPTIFWSTDSFYWSWSVSTSVIKCPILMSSHQRIVLVHTNTLEIVKWPANTLSRVSRLKLNTVLVVSLCLVRSHVVDSLCQTHWLDYSIQIAVFSLLRGCRTECPILAHVPF